MRETENQSGLAGIIDLALIARWWHLLAGGAICAGMLAAVYAAMAAPVYHAEVRVVIQNLGLGSDAGGKPTYDKEFLSTQAEVIRSPAILQRALQMLPPPPRPGTSQTPPELVADLAERLQVNLLAGTDIVRITFEHSNPQYAAERLKSVIESYKEHARSVEQFSTSQSVDLLTKREQELQGQLQKLQQRSLNLRSQNPGGPTAAATDDSPLLRELTNRWVLVESQLASTEAKLAGGDGSATSLIDSPASRELFDLENQAVAARLDAEKVRKIYGPAHPERKMAEQRAADLNREVEDRRRQAVTGLQSLRDSLNRERDQLQSLIARETERLQSINDARLEHEQIQAEIGQVSEIHASTTKALEAVRLADRTLAIGRTSILISVLDEYAVPREAVWPKPMPLIVVAIALGLLLGLAAALVLETRARSEHKQIPVSDELNGFHPAEPWHRDVPFHYAPEALAR